tara:strand:- start:7282 stop:7479 length:198 start_codon:yes stop_codon:yes gene_type:complete
MVEEDKKDWFNLTAEPLRKLTSLQFDLVCELHAKYFKHKFYKPCTCNPKVIKKWIDQLNELYDKN